MSLYEIVNPSDPYTCEADDLKTLAVVAICLGGGAYPIKDEQDETVVPFFLFGGDSAVDAWFREQFGSDFGSAFDSIDCEVAARILDSVIIGRPKARRELEAILAIVSNPEERERIRAEWHDRRRSSMNDIGGRAQSWAKNFRRLAESRRAAVPQ